jgi:hypothetical protein
MTMKEGAFPRPDRVNAGETEGRDGKRVSYGLRTVFRDDRPRRSRTK